MADQMARRSLDFDPDPDDYYSATRFDVLASQMREVKRMLREGSSTQLRVAYILLDNAAEVIMYRSIYPELINNAFHANILRRWEEVVAGTDDPTALEHYEEAKRRVIPPQKLNKIENDFAEKANFLLGRGKVTRDLATSLKELYRYRNEMYHRDHVRYDVLKAVTAIYFDVACSLLERYDETTQHPVWLGPPITVGGNVTEEDFKQPASVLVDELRSGVEWDWPAIARELKENLEGRFQKLTSTVEVLDLLLGNIGDDVVLKLAQTYRSHATSGPDDLKGLAVEYLSTKDLRKLVRRTERLDPTRDHIRFFNHFAEIERSFEALEEPVQALFEDLERARSLAVEEQIEAGRIERFNNRLGDRETDQG
ncbi:hypothetical protein [Micromonospora andamanensis]|uniref:hypothetical protein n=1 Tax=Micromonospora andamanensis TaxID=1287068 RepID=UPI0019508D8B|nr:hypothetical protein [Micromonospora andamanensis]